MGHHHESALDWLEHAFGEVLVVDLPSALGVGLLQDLVDLLLLARRRQVADNVPDLTARHARQGKVVGGCAGACPRSRGWGGGGGEAARILTLIAQAIWEGSGCNRASGRARGWPG